MRLSPKTSQILSDSQTGEFFGFFHRRSHLSHGQWTERLRDWADVIDWLSLAGLSANPALQIPTFRSAEAVKGGVDLRRAWKDELGNLVARSRVSDDFIRRINQILAEDAFYEILHRSGKTGFQLDPSASRLRVEKLALAIPFGISSIVCESFIRELYS
jgi:hypothetical protein